MSAEDALRALVRRSGALQSAAYVHHAVFATMVYVGMGLVTFAILVFGRGYARGPLAFLVVWDLLFALLVWAGASYTGESKDPLEPWYGLRSLVVFGGGFWQVAKSVARASLLALPHAAWSSFVLLVPRDEALSDPRTVRVLERLAKLRGGVSLPLFRCLTGTDMRTLRDALAIAQSIDAVTVNRTGGGVTIVPGREIEKLRAVFERPQGG